MRQALLIPLVCFTAMLAEFCLFNLFGRWGDPGLLLLVVIFFDLYSGVRFALWAAFWAGIFKDCFSTMPFGTNILAYAASAYLSAFIRRTYYERGNDLAKLFLVMCVTTFQVLVLGILQQMVYDEVRWQDVLRSIWLPEVAITVFVALYVFGKLMTLARLFKF